jgi:hypothetical protein
MVHDLIQTPVVFIIFNRPEPTARVFEAIRQARPARLFVAADGPRPDRPGEAERCAATRAIIERVDWDCEVLTRYSEQNLGCKQSVSSGLNWVFDQVETAIILEDDCLPDPSFFRYCQELLHHYRDDTRIMTIAGDNTPLGFQQTRQLQASYFFSIYPRIWGWATWRRAWQLYDIHMTHWLEVQRDRWLQDILHQEEAIPVWKKTLQANYDGADTWACRWLLTQWLQSGLTIIPQYNLISNIGFDLNASNTMDLDNPRANAPRHSLTFPLVHPAFVIADRQADAFTQIQVYGAGRLTRVRRKISRLQQQFKPFSRFNPLQTDTGKIVPD